MEYIDYFQYSSLKKQLPRPGKTELLLRYWHNLSTWICTVHTYRERWNYSAFLMLAMSKPTFQIWKNFWNFLRVLAINSRHDLKGWVVVSFSYTCQLVCFYTCLLQIPILSWIKLNQEQSTTKSLSLSLLISLCVEFKEKEGWALPSHSLLIHCLSIYIRVEFE